MKKLKVYKTKQITTIFFVSIILGSIVIPTMGHENIKSNNLEKEIVKLNGSIIANFFNKYIGTISPSINISNNTSIKLNATKTVNNTYYINSIIKIDVEVIGNITRQYLLGRYLLTIILIDRENNTLGNSLFDLLFSRSPSKIVSKINILTEEEKSILIPLEYETTCISENISMHILAIGMPFRLFSQESPGIVYKIINLELTYNISENFDVTPPVTQCILEGEILR